MPTVPAPAPRVNPIRSRTPLSPVSVVGRFIGGATDEDLLIGAAVLEIEDAKELTSYWCQVVTDRGRVVGYALRKFCQGDVYHLPASLDSCDCPDGTFRAHRPGGCRHQRALAEALAARPAAAA